MLKKSFKKNISQKIQFFLQKIEISPIFLGIKNNLMVNLNNNVVKYYYSGHSEIQFPNASENDRFFKRLLKLLGLIGYII